MIKPNRSSAVCALLLAAFAWTARAEEAPADVKQKPAPAAVTIPARAVETAPGTYSFTDTDGKKWIYRRTPFGVAKFEDSSKSDDATTKKVAEQIHAVEDGEFIQFERPSPFGTYRWRREKAKLDPLEQAAWDHAREKPATQPAAAAKPAAREKE